MARLPVLRLRRGFRLRQGFVGRVGGRVSFRLDDCRAPAQRSTVDGYSRAESARGLFPDC